MPTSFRPTRRELIITSVMLCAFLVLYYRKEDRNPPRQAVSDQSAGQASRQKDAVGRASGAAALIGSPRASESVSQQLPQSSLPAPLDPAPPISSYAPKVNGALQQARLVYKVDPIYPEALKEYEFQYSITLDVTVDENGSVTETVVNDPKAIPAFADAAVSAVEQWRYAPALINGTLSSVSFTIVIRFERDGTVSYVTPTFRVEPNPSMGITANFPRPVPPSENYNGREYYAVTPDMSAPVVRGVDLPRLQAIVKAGWTPLGEISPGAMIFRIYINENGSIDGFQKSPSAPRIASLEEELKNIQVLSPASANGEAIPSYIMLLIDPR